jgi:hypothetical protein
MKWFDENIDAIGPFLRNHVVIENSRRKLLGTPVAIEKLRPEWAIRISRPELPPGSPAKQERKAFGTAP